MSSASISKSHLASIISKPLFIIVAESIVILAPIVHCGCCRASFLVATAICPLDQVLNGPPEAVRWIFLILLPDAPIRHWKIAECSESTGRIAALYFSARAITIGPAATRVSLFASAMVLPALMAEIVGIRPLNPTNAVSTMSIFSPDANAQIESIPQKTFIS